MQFCRRCVAKILPFKNKTLPLIETIMRVYLSLLLLLCCIGNISAQNFHRVTGRVIGTDSKAIEFAAVVLSNKETKKLTGTTTKENGSFILNAKEASYTLEVSLLGYEKYALDLNLDRDIDLGDIVLKENLNNLKEIKITANRVEYNMSGYEYKVGNIAALKNKDLTEVLRTAPGVTVANRITLYGSSVTNIYIDRRRVNMTDETLLAYLRSYKGDNIDKIEVISNPDISARHSGISIKITTKKKEGGFLSASARNTLNKDNFVLETHFNLDYRKEKISFYASGGYMNQHKDGKEVTSYNWKGSGKKTNDITTERIKLPLSINGTFGIGYDITKNDYFSAEVSFREIDKDLKRKIVTENSEGLQDGVFRDYNTVTKTPTTSLMYIHKFKDASELTVTGDYVGSYKSNDIVIGKVDSDGSKEDGKTTHTENNTSTFAAYTNYSKKIKKKHSINVGLRYSYIMNEAINNESRFSYNEGLFRPFASYSVNLKNFGFRAGVSGDWANIDHHDYLDVLPSASVNYYINRKKGNILSVGYSMGVGRPSISQLNPDAVLSDRDIIVRIGNPDLKSYYAHNFSMSLKLLNSYNLSINYKRANDAITSYLYSDEEGTIYQTYTNNASSQDASVSLGVYKNLFNNKLNLNLTGTYSYSESEVNKNTIRNNSLSCAFVAYVSLPKSFSMTAELYANSRKKIGHNAYRKEPFELYLSVSKRIKRWNFSFKVADVFNSFTKGDNMVIDMGNYTQKVTNYSPSRRFTFMATYNFNWGKVSRAKKADTQKKDMNSRIGD